MTAAAADVVASSGSGRLAAHRQLARDAADAIRETRPDTVIVQNYVLPPLEGPVYRAAVDVGARLVVVVHDHHLHSRVAGTRAGLRRHLRQADVVVAHTRFVADAVDAYCGRSDTSVVPLPVALGMVDATPPEVAPFQVDSNRLALYFGVLKRGYKGGATVLELARRGVTAWQFAALGTGAPSGPGLVTVGGYVDSGSLVWAIRSADTVLLPYRMASQSGAVVLAQALGAVPVATAVGGIPEQIEDGVTGRLLPPDAPVESWIAVLQELTDEILLGELAKAAEKRQWENHAAFEAAVTELVR
jgi:glycosyltransferase involved in cell wall biosynthesis